MDMNVGPSAQTLLGDLDAFGNDYWDRAPLHIAASETFDATSILSFKELDRLIGSRHTDTRLIKGGTFLNEDGHREVGLTRADQRTWLGDPAAVLDGFRRGASIVIPHMHELWPPIDVLASQLASTLRATVTASLFVSPAGAVTDWHADDTHGVIIQLHGTKRWMVERDGPGGTPQRRAPLDLRLASGDVLYVPQGFNHHVHGDVGLAVHITFSCRPVSWGELGQSVLSAAFTALAGRRLGGSVVDPNWGPASQSRWSAEADQTLQVLRKALDGVSVTDLVPPADAGQRGLTHDRAFVHASQSTAVSADSVVIACAGLEVHVRSRPDVLEVRFNDRCLELPSWVSPALDQLLAATECGVRARDLPVATNDAVVLVRRLVAEGLMKLGEVEQAQ